MVFVGLKVQVRRFERDRLFQQLLNPLHDRRIVHGGHRGSVVGLVLHHIALSYLVFKEAFIMV